MISFAGTTVLWFIPTQFLQVQVPVLTQNSLFLENHSLDHARFSSDERGDLHSFISSSFESIWDLSQATGQGAHSALSWGDLLE